MTLINSIANLFGGSLVENGNGAVSAFPVPGNGSAAAPASLTPNRSEFAGLLAGQPATETLQPPTSLAAGVDPALLQGNPTFPLNGTAAGLGDSFAANALATPTNGLPAGVEATEADLSLLGGAKNGKIAAINPSQAALPAATASTSGIEDALGDGGTSDAKAQGVAAAKALRSKLKGLQGSFQGTELFQFLTGTGINGSELAAQNRFIREATQAASFDQYMSTPVPVRVFLSKLGFGADEIKSMVQTGELATGSLSPGEIIESLGVSIGQVKEKVSQLKGLTTATPGYAALAGNVKTPSDADNVIAARAKAASKDGSRRMVPLDDAMTKGGKGNAGGLPASHAAASGLADVGALQSVRGSSAFLPGASPLRSDGSLRSIDQILQPARDAVRSRDFFDLQQSLQRHADQATGWQLQTTSADQAKPESYLFPTASAASGPNMGTGYVAGAGFGEAGNGLKGIGTHSTPAADTRVGFLDRAGILTLGNSDAMQEVLHESIAESEEREESLGDSSMAEATPGMTSGMPGHAGTAQAAADGKPESGRPSESFDMSKVIAQITDRTQALVNERGGQARLDLRLERQGDVGINIQVIDNQVSIKVASDDEKTRHELNSAVDALQASLGTKNLDLVDVKFGGSDSFSFNQQQSSNGQQRQQYSWDQSLRDYIHEDSGMPEPLARPMPGKNRPSVQAAGRYKIPLTTESRIQLLA